MKINTNFYVACSDGMSYFSPVDVCRADSAEGRELMMCAIKITANQLVLRLFTTITFDFYGNLIYYLFFDKNKQ